MGFGGLYINGSGMMTAQRGLETISHNLSNVNTEGYSRQRIEQVANRPFEDRWGGILGAGSRVADIIRMRNGLSDAAFRRSVGDKGFHTAASDLLGRAEQILGPLEGGANTALSQFFAAWDAVSIDPTSLTAREEAIGAGKTVAIWLNQGAEDLQRLIGDAAVLTGNVTDEVNALGRELIELNLAVADGVNSGHSPNDMLDKRDLVLDRLVELTGAQIVPVNNNQVNVFVGNTALVIGTDLATMKLGPAGTAIWEGNGSPVVAGGRLGGLNHTATVTVPAMQAELDGLADGLRDLVNATHTAGFDLNGDAGLDFFAGSGASGFAVNGALTADKLAASASGSPNDGNNALTLAGLRTQPMGTGQTPTDGMADFAARIGSITATTRTHAAISSGVVGNIARERAEFSSVSIDEEMTQMIRYQRAYEASARVLTVVDQMLDTLINRTGLVGR